MLINNAGIVTGKKFLEGSDKMQALTMDVNATAHFWTVKSVLPEMMEQQKRQLAAAAGKDKKKGKK